MVSKFLTSLAASALVLAPVAASAAPKNAAVSQLPTSARAASPTAKANRLAGVSALPAILAALIVAGGIYLVIDDNDDDSDSN